MLSPNGNQFYTKENGIITGDNHSCLIGKECCALQPTAAVLREAELFYRFINNIIWIAASESTNERIRQAVTSAFANSGLELTFHRACAAD